MTSLFFYKSFILLDINEPNFLGQIFGRSEKDILLLMSDGIAHYNGIDVQYLKKN